MTVDFSKFKPSDFLPKLLPDQYQSCPAADKLKTGDLLFPRLPKRTDFTETLHRNRYSDLLLKSNTLEWFGVNNNKKIVDILGGRDGPVVTELLAKVADPIKFSAARSLDISAVISEIKPFNHNSNSLYASHEGMQILNQIFDLELQHTEGWAIDFSKFLEDPRLIKLVIEILIVSGFGKLVENWFGAAAPVTSGDFRKDPLVKLLLDLLTSDDVRTNMFIGHVGIVIRENADIVFIIEANITSYSHYRVAIHPYYVKKDDEIIQNYLNKNYDFITKKYKDTTDYELPAAQASGWVNRRAAMLEYVWHARPDENVFGDGWQEKLISTAKALHGRPFGFFDNPNFGHDDRMYCAEYVYNVFKNGISEPLAKKLTKKMTWGDIKKYLHADGNTKMENFVINILGDHAKYAVTEDKEFFVLPPAILWNSPSLKRIFKPYNEEYAPII